MAGSRPVVSVKTDNEIKNSGELDDRRIRLDPALYAAI